MSESQPANLLGMVALDVSTRVAAAVEDATGVSMVQATALSALAVYADGDSVETVRRAVGLSHSATVRLVDRLVELGLVERRTDARTDDRRRAAVHLTGTGRRLARAAQRARGRVLHDTLARLAAREQRTLGPLLFRLAGASFDPDDDGDVDYVCRWCDPAACGFPDDCPVVGRR